jgi:hypothetical protein
VALNLSYIAHILAGTKLIVHRVVPLLILLFPHSMFFVRTSNTSCTHMLGSNRVKMDGDIKY